MGLSFSREFRRRQEDDEALARFVRQGPEAENYSVSTFLPDGEQAQTAATHVDYDVVILDLNPAETGWSHRAALPAAEKAQPARAGADQAQPGRRRIQCLDTGVDDYVPK